MGTVNIMQKAVEEYKNIKSEKYLGIFGNPIKHTLSPIIHDTISDRLSLNERYIPFEIEDDLGEYVKAAYEEGIVGLNITVPYKEKVIPYLSQIDEDAKKIGAVNTLVRTNNGYKGYNTDMEGLYKAVVESGMQIKDNEIIMLGAGGAARAVAYMCLKYGAKRVYIINRSSENVKKLAKDMNELASSMKNTEAETKTSKDDKFIPLLADAYTEIPHGKYMFIQCTSVGLKEDDGLPLVSDEKFYRQASCAVDLIYNPAKTKFLSLMEENNVPYINGLKMLLYQGIIANELWNGISIDVKLSDEIFSALNKKLYF
jgi:shikimate dehydrogenase